MSDRDAEEAAPTSALRTRCRCGHWPTDHMVVAPVAAGGGYRLDAVGPCRRCGESVCRKFSPGG